MEWLAGQRGLIDDFLRRKRIAIVGVSRSDNDFSRAVYDEFRKRGYDAVPVNPHAARIGDAIAFPNVRSIAPAVDAVLIMTDPLVTESVVQDCRQAGVRRVWLHKGAGKGAVSDKAVRYCLAHSMNVVYGYCPLMFLPNAHVIHRAHAFCLRLTGTYPA